MGAIVLTHTHADHTADVEALWRGTGAGIALHGGDPIPAQQPNGPRLHLLREGDLLALGPHRLEIMHVPGHSFDSIALWESKQKILFSGDTVQAGGYGGNLRDPDFLSSMARIAALPGDARLLAGHGRATTVGDEAGWMNSMVEEQSAFLLAHPSAIVTPTCNCRLHSTRSLYNRPGPLF